VIQCKGTCDRTGNVIMQWPLHPACSVRYF